MENSIDTIVAIATPIGRGGIGIIRISGKEARVILGQVFRPSGGEEALRPRYLAYGEIVDFGAKADLEEEEILDQALAVYMPAPHSYTGEDVAELQCHGSPRLLEEILSLVLLKGARLVFCN